MKDDAMMVLVDEEYAASAPALWRGLRSVSANTDAEVRDALAEGTPQLVVLHGGASLVSRALTVWHSVRERRAASVTFAVVPVCEAPVHRALGGVERLGAYAKALRSAAASGSFETVSLPTIALVDSGLPARRLGFSVGFGLLAEPFTKTTELAERSLDDPSDPFRWTVDRLPQPTSGFLLASSLPVSVGGISMAKGLSHRAGDHPATLLPQTTRLGRMVSRATGLGAAKSFTRIHIDGASGYLLDDVAQEVRAPGVVELRSGPRCRFARV